VKLKQVKKEKALEDENAWRQERQRLADGNACFECGKVTVTNEISECLCFEENGVNGHGVRICNMPRMSRSRHHSPLFDLFDDALRCRLWYTHVLQLLRCMLHFLYQYEVCPWLVDLQHLRRIFLFKM